MHGTYYSKIHASTVALKLKEKMQMRKVIRNMNSTNRVPSVSTRLLYDIIKMRSNGIFFIDNEWTTRCKYVKNLTQRCGGRMRNLRLALQPVMIDDEPEVLRKQMWCESMRKLLKRNPMF